MAIAGNLHHDECGIEAMFTAMKQADNPRVAYNIVWMLSHLSKEDKRCFRRGLILTILTDMPMDEPDGKLLDFCLTHLADPKESDGSRSVMIKLAARMCKPYPELCKELTLCLDMMPQDSSPSIAAAKRNALKMIRK